MDRENSFTIKVTFPQGSQHRHKGGGQSLTLGPKGPASHSIFIGVLSQVASLSLLFVSCGKTGAVFPLLYSGEHQIFAQTYWLSTWVMGPASCAS